MSTGAQGADALQTSPGGTANAATQLRAGLIPLLRTTFGLIPLFGHGIWLHALLAGIAAYFGFAGRFAPGGENVTTGTPPLE